GRALPAGPAGPGPVRRRPAQGGLGRGRALGPADPPAGPGRTCRPCGGPCAGTPPVHPACHPWPLSSARLRPGRCAGAGGGGDALRRRAVAGGRDGAVAKPAVPERPALRSAGALPVFLTSRAAFATTGRSQERRMPNEITIAGRKIGPAHPPLVIAEIGIHHGGDLAVATEMVR